jgi:hypothetical protein
MTDTVAVVIAFNEAINGRDVAALTELMTESGVKCVGSRRGFGRASGSGAEPPRWE